MGECKICGVICSSIVEVITYVDTDSPSVGEIYETINTMIDHMNAIIHEKDSTLDLCDTHILPTIQRRWDKINTPFHMAAYALNLVWYVMKPRRVAHLDDMEVKKGFMKAQERCILLKRPKPFMING